MNKTVVQTILISLTAAILYDFVIKPAIKRG